MAVDPKSVNAHVALAGYYRHVGRPLDAEGTLKAVLAFVPTSVEANLALVNLYLETDRAVDAEAPLLTLAGTGAADYRMALADYYATRNRPREALELLTELMNEEGANVAARSRMAGLDYQAGRRAQAHAALDTLAAERRRPTRRS